MPNRLNPPRKTRPMGDTVGVVPDFNILGKNSVRPVGLRSAELQCSCGSPPGIADKPIILPFKRDAAKGPSIHAPWQTEKTSCTRLNWPNRRRDMTVRLRAFRERSARSQQCPCPGGIRGAGTAVHMDWSDERQNGGGFVGRMNLLNE